MERRRFLSAGAMATTAMLASASGSSRGAEATTKAAPVPDELKLRPPADGTIDVAFCISQGSNVIDMAGPWEVFQDATIEREGRQVQPFRLFTVADTKDPVRATGGLHLIPDHAIAEAPAPRIVVVPALRGTDAVRAWLRQTAERADLVMSVCTGAFQLARAGLLDGREATTHHDFWDDFESTFPKVRLRRGPRFVEGPRIATAGGLTSGIDLALRVVERYFGRPAAQATADYMEYRSDGWKA